MTPEKIGIFTAALFAGKNLKVLGILMAVAAFTGSFMLVKVALLVYAIMAIKTAADPDFGRKALEEAAYVRGERKTLPASGGKTATKLQGRHLEMQKRARASLAEVGQRLDSLTDPFLKQQLSGVRPQLTAMVQRIEALCAAAQEMDGAALDEHAVATEIAALELKAQDSADEQARAHYLDAAAQKRQVLDNASTMKKNAARMDAELTSLAGTLERFGSDVARVVATALVGGAAESFSRVEVAGLTSQLSSIVTAVDELEKLGSEDRRDRRRSRVS